MAAPSPYADILRQMQTSDKTVLPVAVEDMYYIAAMIATAMAKREAATHCRVHFGHAGALEAAHKLAAWVMALPPGKRAEIEEADPPAVKRAISDATDAAAS